MSQNMIDNAGESLAQDLNVQTKAPFPKHILILGIAIIALLVITFFSLWKIIWQYNSSPVPTLSEIRTHYVSLNQKLDSALDGDTYQFSNLQVDKNKIESLLPEITELDPIFSQQLSADWGAIETEISFLTAQQELIKKLPNMRRAVQNDNQAFSTLLTSFSEIISTDGTYTTETVREINQLAISAQNINTQLSNVLLADIPDISATAGLTAGLKDVNDRLAKLINGDPDNGIQAFKDSSDEERILEAQTIFKQVRNNAGALLDNLPEIIAIKQHLLSFEQTQDQFSNLIDNRISEYYISDTKLYQKLKLIATIIALIWVICIIIFFFIFSSLKYKTTTLKFMAYSEKERNEQHEKAIMKLIDEVELIAQGDLSAVLSVTEDSTGIIADSINLAIESIRQIVLKVRAYTEKLDDSINQLQNLQSTDAASLHLQINTINDLNEQIRLLQQIEKDIIQNFDKIDGQSNEFNRVLLNESNILAELNNSMPKLNTQAHDGLESIRDITKQVQDLKPILIRYTKAQESFENLLQNQSFDPQNLHNVMIEQKQLNQYTQKFWSNLQSNLIKIMTIATQTTQTTEEMLDQNQQLQDINLDKQSKAITFLQQVASFHEQFNNLCSEIKNSQENVEMLSTETMNQRNLQIDISNETTQQRVFCDELKSATNTFILPTDDPLISQLDLSLTQVKLKSNNDE